MEKILKFGDEPICLFCGNKMKQKWEDRESYYECDCADAIKNRQIDNKIQFLNEQRPKKKFIIEDVRILRNAH